MMRPSEARLPLYLAVALSLVVHGLVWVLLPASRPMALTVTRVATPHSEPIEIVDLPPVAESTPPPAVEPTSPSAAEPSHEPPPEATTPPVTKSESKPSPPVAEAGPKPAAPEVSPPVQRAKVRTPKASPEPAFADMTTTVASNRPSTRASGSSGSSTARDAHRLDRARSASPGAAKATRPSRKPDCSERAVKPVPKHRVPLRYPAAARAEGIEARVVLRAPVDPDASGGYYQPVRASFSAVDGSSLTAFGRQRIRCDLAGATRDIFDAFQAEYLVNTAPIIAALVSVGPPEPSRIVQPGASVQWVVELDATSSEAFPVYHAERSELERRNESLIVDGYVTGGILEPAYYARSGADFVAGDHIFEFSWTAPQSPGRYHVWTVVHDERGGANWTGAMIEVGPGMTDGELSSGS